MPTESSTSVRVFYPRLTREEVIARLKAGVQELERSLPLIRVALFGSYASDSYTVGSDVDLLVVHEGELRPDAYRLIKQAMGIPRLEPHVYTEREGEAAKDKLEIMLKRSLPIYPGGPSFHGPDRVTIRFREVRDPDNNVWILTRVGASGGLANVCLIIQTCEEHPSVERQQALCGWTAGHSGCDRAYKLMEVTVVRPEAPT